jgi:hypothetical protein
MTPRYALRFVAAAAVLASLFVIALRVLDRWQSDAQAEVPQARIDVPLTGVALQLDANGVGAQVVRGAQLTYRLQPYPPRADVESTLSFVAVDRNTGRTLPLTPTLEVAPLDAVEGRMFTVEAFPENAYLSRGIFFAAPGGWRMRVASQLFADEPYTTVIIAIAE